MMERDVFSGNVWVGGYAKAGYFDEALNFYHRVMWAGVKPDVYTLSSGTGNDTLMMKKVLAECAYKFSNASDALQSSLQDLADEEYDYALLHVMAAADYPNACHNAFRRYPGMAYPRELAAREVGLKRICDVVISIINLIGF